MMWQILLGPLAQPDLASMFQVVAENPAVAAARSNLGVALKASGRLEEAEAQLLLAVQLDSTYARGYNNLGNAQQALGRHAEPRGRRLGGRLGRLGLRTEGRQGGQRLLHRRGPTRASSFEDFAGGWR